VLLVDVQMPGLNGVELALRLRASGVSTPIILTAGSSGHEQYVDQVGACGFLLKPYDICLLLDQIAAACGGAGDALTPNDACQAAPGPVAR
jgi:FixJ family two-component response regulator